jgi:hypothetical protein
VTDDQSGAPGDVGGAARSVAIPTWAGGWIILPEPDWCAGHSPDAQHPRDIVHDGPVAALEAAGVRVLEARLTQAPFREGDSTQPAVLVTVRLGDRWHDLDPTALCEFADDLCAHAEELRSLAVKAATLTSKTT